MFQGRYGAVPVTDEPQLHAVVRYLALNPVEAGLCGEPERWPWSSYVAVLGAAWPSWLAGRRLLGLLGNAGGDPRRRYVDLVTASGPRRSPA